MRDRLADWLRRLAERVAPRTARAGAGFQQAINFYAIDMGDMRKQWAVQQRREARKYAGRP